MGHDTNDRDGRTQFIMNGTLVEANLNMVYNPDTKTYSYNGSDRVYSFTRYVNNNLEIRVRAYGEDGTWFLESPGKWNLHYRNGLLVFENTSYSNKWLVEPTKGYRHPNFDNHSNVDFLDVDTATIEYYKDFRISYNLKHNNYDKNWALDKYINDFWITWNLVGDTPATGDNFRVHINGKYLSSIPDIDLDNKKWRGYIDPKRVKYQYKEDNIWMPAADVEQFTTSVTTWKYLNMHGGGRNAVFGHVMFDNTSKGNTYTYTSSNRDNYSKRIYDLYSIDKKHLRDYDTQVGPYGPLLQNEYPDNSRTDPVKEFYEYDEKFDQYAFGLTRHDLALTWVGNVDSNNISESFLFFKPLNYTWNDWDTVARNNWIWDANSANTKRIVFLDGLSARGEKPYFYPPTKPAIPDGQVADSWVLHEFERLGHANGSGTSRPFATINNKKIPLNSWEAMQQEGFTTAFDFNSNIKLLQVEGDLNDMITDSNCQSFFNQSENFWSKNFHEPVPNQDFPDTRSYSKDDGTLYSTDTYNQMLNKNSIGCYSFMNIASIQTFFDGIKTNVDNIDSGYTIGVTGVFNANLEVINWNYTDANIIHTLGDDWGYNDRKLIRPKAINPTIAYTLGQNMALYKYFPPVKSRTSEGKSYYKHAVNDDSDNVFALRFRMLTASTRIVQVDSEHTPPENALFSNVDNFNNNVDYYLEDLMNPNIQLRSYNSASRSDENKYYANGNHVPLAEHPEGNLESSIPEIYIEGELQTRQNYQKDGNIGNVMYDAPFKRAQRYTNGANSSRANDPAISSFMISGGLDHLFLNQNRYYDEGTYGNVTKWVGANDKSEKPYEFSSWSLVFDGETSNISFYVANVTKDNYCDIELDDRKKYLGGTLELEDIKEFEPSNLENAIEVFKVKLDTDSLAWKNPTSAYDGQKGPFCYKLNNGLYYNSALDFVLNVEFASVTLYCNGVQIVTGPCPAVHVKNYTGAKDDYIDTIDKQVIPPFNQIKIINTTQSNSRTRVQHFPLDKEDFSATTASSSSNIVYDRPLIIDLFEFTRTRAWKQHYLEVVSNPFVSIQNNLTVPQTNAEGQELDNKYIYQPPPWFPDWELSAGAPSDNLFSESDNWQGPPDLKSRFAGDTDVVSYDD